MTTAARKTPARSAAKTAARAPAAKATQAPARAARARANLPVRDAAATREALLVAAVEEFARNGFAGARVDLIAASAGVNKQLVYHYFGNKEGLYRDALEAVYAQLREKERALSLADMAPAEAMAALVGFSFDYLSEHPEFISLLADENRNAGQHIRESASLQQMHLPLVEMLEATLARGVAEAVFRDDYDAINLYISVAGLSYFYFSNNHTLSVIFAKKLSSRAAHAQRRKHVIEFTLNALRPGAD